MRKILLVLSVLSLFSCNKENINKTEAVEIENISIYISNLSYSSATYGEIEYTAETGEKIVYKMNKNEVSKVFNIQKGSTVKFLGVRRVLNASNGIQSMSAKFTIQVNGNIVKEVEDYVLNYQIN